MIKKIFLALAILILFGFQQLVAQESPAELKFYVNDSIFDTVEVPDEYKNNSALILARYTFYEIIKTRGRNKLSSKYVNRYRIKLMDKKSVEEYSTFNFGQEFNYQSGFYKRNKIQFLAAFNVIKKNGEIRNIDLSEAVDETVEVKAKEIKEKKIAIPDLEVGDIVDYSIGYIVPYRAQNVLPFDNEYFFLQRQYPILNLKFRIDLGEDCFLKAKSFNGGPEFISKNLDEDIRTYALTVSNIEGFKAEAISDFRNEIPYIKFQVCFVRKSAVLDGYDAVFNTKNPGIKNSLNPSEFMHLVKLSTPQGVVMTPEAKTAQKCIRYLKSKGYKKGDCSPEVIRLAYYYLKFECYSTKFNIYYRGAGYFRRAFVLFFNRWDVDYGVFIVNYNRGQEAKDILFTDEFASGLYIPKLNQFISDFSLIGHYGLYNPQFQGQTASVFNVVTNQHIGGFKIPIISSDTNRVETKISAILHVEEEKLEIKQHVKSYGNAIIPRIGVLDYLLFLKEMNSNYKFGSFGEKAILSYNKYREEASDSTLKKDIKHSLEEHFSDQLKEVYDEKIKPRDIKIEQYGVYGLEEGYMYSYAYEVDQPIIKNGNEIIVSLENLFVPALKENELTDDRKTNINVDHSFKQKEKLIFYIPEGYKLKDHSTEGFEKEFSFGSISFKLEENEPDYIAFVLEADLNQYIIDKSKWNEIKAFFSSIEGASSTAIIFEKK